MKHILHGLIAAPVFAGVVFTTVCSAAVLFSDPSSTTGTTFGSTIGAVFTVGAANISVTHLGVYDHGADGFAGTHEVGLWENSSGRLLASATIRSGTASPLSGSYRYEPISAQLLTAGASYTIGALFKDKSDVVASGGDASVDPALASADPQWFHAGPDSEILSRLDMDLSSNLWAANMQFSVDTNPGPSPGTKPTISLLSPTAGAVYALPTNVTFSAQAVAFGAARVEYFQGTRKLGEATSPPYTVAWTTSKSGAYTFKAKVTDAQKRFAFSTPVRISVVRPVTISTPPASRELTAGKTVTFSVKASGTVPLRYQWLFNGTPIAGATKRLLTLKRIQPENAGMYSVRVSNSAGTVESVPAVLTLLE